MTKIVKNVSVMCFHDELKRCHGEIRYIEGSGMALLMFYSLGLVIPFILSALAISAFLASFSRLKKHFKVIKIVSGVILIIMGVLMLMNKMTVLIHR